MFFHKSESVLEIDPPDQAVPIDIAGETNKNWITGRPPPQLITTSASHQTPPSISDRLLSEMARLEHTTKLLIDVQDLSDLFS
jgi:hypothetical protein